MLPLTGHLPRDARSLGSLHAAASPVLAFWLGMSKCFRVRVGAFSWPITTDPDTMLIDFIFFFCKVAGISAAALFSAFS